MTRFSPIALIVIAAGCRQVECAPSEGDVTYNIEGNTTNINQAPSVSDTNENVDDTGSEDTGDTAEVEDTAEELGNPKLEVWFSTFWSADYEWATHPGQAVNMGSLMFMSDDERMIRVDQVGLAMTVNDSLTTFSRYNIGHDGDVSAVDHIVGCSLTDPMNGAFYGWGQVNEAGWLYIPTNDLYAGPSGSAAVVNVVCTFEGEPSDSTGDGFAIQPWSVDATAQESNETAEPYFTGDNGSWSNPTVAAILLPTDPEPNECVREVVAWNGTEVIDTLANELQAITRSAQSPDGDATPGAFKALQVNLASADEECATLYLSWMRLRVTATDNANTQWRSGLENKIQVFDLSNTGTVQVGMTMNGWWWDGNDLYVDLAGAYDGIRLDPGTTGSVGIWVDSTGASALMHDELQVMVVANTISVWDGNKTVTLAHDGVLGNVLTF